MHQLRRLSSRGSHRRDHGTVTEQDRYWSEAGWHRPVTSQWTGSTLDYHQHHGQAAAAAASVDYHRTTSYEGKQIPFF